LTTDECFNKNLLQLEDYSTRYIIGLATGGDDTVNLKVRLPAGVSCEYCVFQMWWKTDINNNQCGSIGCGNQEEYKNCADVRIVSNGGGGITTPSPILTTPPTTVLVIY
jgi:hypothetical protein